MNKLLCALLAAGTPCMFASSKKSGSSDTPAPHLKQTDTAGVDSKVATFMSTYAIPGASLAAYQWYVCSAFIKLQNRSHQQ